MQFVYKFEAMSTPCELILFSDTKSKADEVVSSVLSEAKRLEKKYSYYNPNSLLSQLNRRSENRLDHESKSLLQRAKQYYNETGGIFDITIATIKDLYTHERSIESLNRQKDELLPYVGCEHFEIKKNKLYFDNKFTKIDLGGFVKEYAVDKSVQIIKKQKIKSALINFGGDIYALGKKPNGEKFKVGIKDPNNRAKHIQFEEIENQALTTSANYERNHQIEDKNYSHILSKREFSKMPKSVTVISENCVLSGVYSTSIMINHNLKIKKRVIII